MSDMIERDKVIEYCLKLIDVERKQGSDVMNYGQERINQTDTIIAFVENLPSEESSWSSVLAELHERFSALEKELRRASAEMSAIIRGYVDGQKDEPPSDEDCDYCKMTHKYWYEHCGCCEHKPKDEPQTCSVSGRPYSECADCEHFRCTADEPRTEVDCDRCKHKGVYSYCHYCDGSGESFEPQSGKE